jgi:CheY-like chemotaxis protein
MFNFGKERELPALLLIDDDMVSREVLATVLTMHGFSVETAAGGAEALVVLEGGWAPGAILMDAQMPGLSGLELIRALRARSSARICVLSASAVPESLAAAADGFLFKPLDPGALEGFFAAHPVPTSQPEPPPPPAAPVISPATLQQLRALMPDGAVKEIFTALVADLDNKLESLAAAIAARDGAEIRRIGHAIKGGCGMAGALEIAHLAARLESEGNHLDNSASLLEQMRAALQRLRSMLVTEFQP